MNKLELKQEVDMLDINLKFIEPVRAKLDRDIGSITLSDLEDIKVYMAIEESVITRLATRTVQLPPRKKRFWH